MNKKYSIKIHKKASKFIAKLPPKVKKSVENWLAVLEHDPYNANDGKMVNIEFENCKQCPIYKKRFGSIRIIYAVNDTEIIIIIFKAGNRGQIYKNI